MRDLFHKLVDAHEKKARLNGASQPWTLVYTSRTNAVRMIHNEDELIQQLKNTLGVKHVVVHTGKEKLIEQARALRTLSPCPYDPITHRAGPCP